MAQNAQIRKRKQEADKKRKQRKQQKKQAKVQDGEKLKEYFLYLLDNNSFVADIDFKRNRISYKNEFYLELFRKLESGMNYLDAYRALGFDPDILGEDRANAACRRAKETMEKDGKTILKTFDGSVPVEKMTELKPEEQLEYFKCREKYLETIIEYQKKIDLWLEENNF